MGTLLDVPNVRSTRRGDYIRAKYHKHTEKCRERVHEALRIVGAEKIRAADSDNPNRTRTKADQKAPEPPVEPEAAATGDESMADLPEPEDVEILDADDGAMDEDNFYKVVDEAQES